MWNVVYNASKRVYKGKTKDKFNHRTDVLWYCKAGNCFKDLCKVVKVVLLCHIRVAQYMLKKGRWKTFLLLPDLKTVFTWILLKIPLLESSKNGMNKIFQSSHFLSAYLGKPLLSTIKHYQGRRKCENVAIKHLITELRMRWLGEGVNYNPQNKLHISYDFRAIKPCRTDRESLMASIYIILYTGMSIHL